MSFAITNGPVGVNVALEQTKDNPEHRLGLEVEGVDESGHWKRYKYVRMTAAKTQHLVYIIDDDNLVGAGLTTTNDGGAPLALGVFDATTSGPASGYTYSYAWIQVAGYFEDISILASCVHNVELLSSGTAGKLDDAGGKLVHAVKMVNGASLVAAADVECYSAVNLYLPTDA